MVSIALLACACAASSRSCSSSACQARIRLGFDSGDFRLERERGGVFSGLPSRAGSSFAPLLGFTLRVFLRRRVFSASWRGCLELRVQTGVSLGPEASHFRFEGLRRRPARPPYGAPRRAASSRARLGFALRLLLHRASRRGLDTQALNLRLDLRFGLSARPGDFAGQRHRGGFFSRTAGFIGRTLFMLAPPALGFLPHAIDLALKLSIGILAHAREFRRQTSLGVCFDASDFFGGGACGRFLGGRSGLLDLAFAHRCGFGLNAGDVLSLGAVGRFAAVRCSWCASASSALVRTRDSSSASFRSASSRTCRSSALRPHGLSPRRRIAPARPPLRVARRLRLRYARVPMRAARQPPRARARVRPPSSRPLVRPLPLDARECRRRVVGPFRTHALDLGDHLRALFGGFRFHARQFGGALFSGFCAHALEFGGHPRVGLRLNERDLRGVHLGVDGIGGWPRFVLGTARLGEIIDGDVEIRFVLVVDVGLDSGTGYDEMSSAIGSKAETGVTISAKTRSPGAATSSTSSGELDSSAEACERSSSSTGSMSCVLFVAAACGIGAGLPGVAGATPFAFPREVPICETNAARSPLRSAGMDSVGGVPLRLTDLR